MTTLPNFLVIGAGKAGTTALYHYLKQHPEIFMSPVKETNFFAVEGMPLNFGGPGADKIINKKSINDKARYLELFEQAGDARAIGEVSPLYLYSPIAAERIYHLLPQVKLIAILRNPVDRAYSSYMHLIRDHRETITDFSQALEAEPERLRDNWEWIWFYKDMGFYYTQLKRYYDLFDRSQIRVYLYEDWNRDNNQVFRDICGFLNVDDKFLPKFNVRFNVSGVHTNLALIKFLKQKNPLKSFFKQFLPVETRKAITSSLMNTSLEKTAIAPAAKRQLLDDYQEDILNLQTLIQRDLSHWLKP